MSILITVKRPINIRLDDDLVNAADALAAAMGTDRTELISRSLRRELLYEGTREFVYVLLDENQAVRYVGRSGNPYGRLRAHIAESRYGSSGSAKQEWIRELLAQGLVPQLVIIDEAEPGEPIRELEAEWIEHFKTGQVLTNGRNGWRGGVAPEPRKSFRRQQVGKIDKDLLDRVDAQARKHDQTRRTYIERALQEYTGEPQEKELTPESKPITGTTPLGPPCKMCKKAEPPKHKPCPKCGHQKPDTRNKKT